MESEKTLHGTLQIFEGSRFRIRSIETKPGVISTGRNFIVDELQSDGTWKRIRMVQSINIRIHVDKITEVEIVCLDGLPREERPK